MDKLTFHTRPRKALKRGQFKVIRVTPMRTSPLKKVGKPTLHKKAWAVFSKWVRNRDKRCVTCGSTKTLQAGHFYHNVLDFDEININTQCTYCNKHKHGNLAIYSAYLLNKYGQQALEQLNARHYLALRGEFRTDEEYRQIMEKYKLSTVALDNY